jgi:hypothetical protein
MKSHVLRSTGKVLKLVFVCSVLLYIAVFHVNNQLAVSENQYFDLRSAALISIGFAVSFRAMLCCRKKV